MKKEINILVGIVGVFTVCVGILSGSILRYQGLILQNIEKYCGQLWFVNYEVSLNSKIHTVVWLMTIVISLIALEYIASIFRYHLTYFHMASKRIPTPQRVKDIVKKVGSKPRVLMVVNDEKPYARCFGFFISVMVISQGMIDRLSYRQLEAVLIHEAHHLRNRHHQLIFIMETLWSGLFFLPILRDFSYLIKSHLEQDADRATVYAQGTDKHLRWALVNSLVDTTSHETIQNGVGFQSIIEDRINRLKDNSVVWIVSKRRLLISVFSLIVLATFVALPLPSQRVMCVP